MNAMTSTMKAAVDAQVTEYSESTGFDIPAERLRMVVIRNGGLGATFVTNSAAEHKHAGDHVVQGQTRERTRGDPEDGMGRHQRADADEHVVNPEIRGRPPQLRD